ncbi:MAG: bifunctional 2-polyprenyl-6-hydroxyphenol methylase/3-demethylubiquinol 3-O-methyltransferase UbiG [Pseudomonadota bacterium]|uniref:bifunctional 2-polyprenyl-6-hydroxyphenol methylase/3-demethylubiquinol 3-O-methyltransferase UbiG n=1 Tax=Gallaecimonas pentaromativorans TaxID=584787 RepID=UPI00067F6CAE|nr:bifunctional 2-polyprenyl-6-hydroxyphenol methylase/3-demethylubiquinol 3-O-methyltransferase UbiG [Gallaecimonas pentaromativorans]MED5525543.1 bifunctional 2-polyprenyl-6-hydroxyphenol methylase/3-demethylubiquinol 3-O-methyltransferase UbiG [Pseudomonadota bacterium]
MNNNVDNTEIAKFEAMAHRWWDKEGEFKPLHQLNPVRLAFVEEMADGIGNKRIVDIGCGGGILSESMARLGAVVTGADMGTEPLNVARAHAEEVGVALEYRQITAEALAEELPGQFDVVTCMEMLEHVPDPQSVVSACAKLCKPGGMLVFSTLNRTPKAWALGVFAAERILRWLPAGTHDFQKFIKPAELMAFCDNAGLIPLKAVGMSYNLLTGQFSRSEKLDMNYLVAARKPV